MPRSNANKASRSAHAAARSFGTATRSMERRRNDRGDDRRLDAGPAGAYDVLSQPFWPTSNELFFGENIKNARIARAFDVRKPTLPVKQPVASYAPTPDQHQFAL